VPDPTREDILAFVRERGCASVAMLRRRFQLDTGAAERVLRYLEDVGELDAPEGQSYRVLGAPQREGAFTPRQAEILEALRSHPGLSLVRQAVTNW